MAENEKQKETVPDDNSGNNDDNTLNVSVVSQTDDESKQFILADLEIPKFNPEQNMKIKDWLTFYENQVKLAKLPDCWKYKNIHRFLAGQALNVFLSNCQEATSFEEIKNVLIMYFENFEEDHLAEFFNLTLK